MGLGRLRPGVGVEVLGGQRRPIAEEVERAPAAGMGQEVLVQRCGLGDRIPRRVDHGVADPAADDVVPPPVHLALRILKK